MKRTCVTSRDDGTAAIEFGLIAMIIFMLVFGAIDFGMWTFAGSQASESAREASRVAMLNPVDTPTPLTSAPPSGSPLLPVWQSALDYLGTTTPDFALEVHCNPCAAGSQVTVTVSWTRQSLTFMTATSTVRGASTRTIVGTP